MKNLGCSGSWNLHAYESQLHRGEGRDIPNPVTHMMSLDFKVWGAMGSGCFSPTACHTAQLFNICSSDLRMADPYLDLQEYNSSYVAVLLVAEK